MPRAEQRSPDRRRRLPPRRNIRSRRSATSRDDNNVVWFLAHRIEALRPRPPDPGAELGQVLNEHGEGADRYVLTLLINDSQQSGQPLAPGPHQPHARPA